MSELIKLVASKVVFYSKNDESAFFDWIKKIPSIERFEGHLFDVFLYIKKDKVDECDLREIISIFWRYKIEMSQLSVFDEEKFSGWFRKKNCFWYDYVFCDAKF